MFLWHLQTLKYLWLSESQSFQIDRYCDALKNKRQLYVCSKWIMNLREFSTSTSVPLEFLTVIYSTKNYDFPCSSMSEIYKI